MENKINYSILAAILLILAIPLAVAYPVTMQLNGNMDFNTAVYHCSGSACTALSGLYDSDSGNPLSYVINNEGSGTQYFAEYDYVTDRCYASHAYRNWFDESTDNGPWAYDVDFQKQEDCEAEIISFDYDNSISDGEIQEISVNVKSPFNLNSEGPGIVPEELEYYYSTDVEVEIEIEKDGLIIYEETKSSDIEWSTDKQFDFTFEPIENGIYSLTIKTKVNDCMCSSYVEQEETATFEVDYTPEPPQDTIPPSIEIISPENKTYNTTEILVEIAASDENLAEVWFFDGTSYFTYAGPVYMTFPEGTNEVVAWADDESGNTNSASVIFNIVLPGEGEENIPPVADFEYSPEEPLVDEEITFDASSSYDLDGTITEYSWDIDGTILYGQTATYQYGGEGDYDITLTVTDDDGDNAQITKTITVSQEEEDDEEDNEETCHSGRTEIEIKDIEKKNVDCGGVVKINFRIKNWGDKREDVLVKIENPELNIQKMRIITLESKEEELISFYLDIPLLAEAKLHYVAITAESSGKIIEETYPIQVKCESTNTIIVTESGKKESLVSLNEIEGSNGITGKVIAETGGFVNPKITVALLGILVLILLASVVVANRK